MHRKKEVDEHGKPAITQFVVVKTVAGKDK